MDEFTILDRIKLWFKLWFKQPLCRHRFIHENYLYDDFDICEKCGKVKEEK